MERHKFQGEEVPKKELLSTPEQKYKVLESKNPVESFSDFSEEQQEEIDNMLKILLSLAHFIGNDFHIPVELNKPGAGWHWDFKNNIIRIDPSDILLEKFNEKRQKMGQRPLSQEEHENYLRGVICHEGFHKRLTKTEFINMKDWKELGYGLGLNAPEDIRVNTAGAEYYPRFGGQLDLMYEQNLDFESKEKQKAKKELGKQPRFIQAVFKILELGFQWHKGEKMEIGEGLSIEVKEYVKKMLPQYENFWRLFPTKAMADGSEKDENKLTGEKSIYRHSEESYGIYRDNIWPEFKKLVDMDIGDQKMQGALGDMQKNQEEGSPDGQDLPQDLKDKLTKEEQESLKEAIKKVLDQSQVGGEEKPKDSEKAEGGQQAEEQEGVDKESEAKKDSFNPVDLDSLSKELKQKIKEYVDSLSKEQQEEMEESAKARLKEFEDSLNEELQGKLSETPEMKVKREEEQKSDQEQVGKKQVVKKESPSVDPKELKKYKKHIAKELKKDANVYEKMRREVLPLIDKLENEVRDIFTARKMGGWKSGNKTGPKIDLKKRIEEKAKSISIVESKAWQKKELPKEKDYAIGILNDLSGSMKGEKIYEDFKSKIVISEVLNRLSINTEILGFNDRIYEYQNFGQPMSKQIRENMGGMLSEVNDTSDTGKARWNDDGWAVQQAAERLMRQKADYKFLIVMSDGEPVESPMHPREKYELSGVIAKLLKETNIRIIGLGIGNRTDHVRDYYPNSIANVKVKEMAEKLADLIREVIADYDKF
ncbi:MAG: hypothetical protein A3C58_00840 [Candidatus Staskawiczbacteria bacterium RIFCSPHIGHO2_02_FULL_34_10]|uniref:VWFA domain-containing protein n=2 Tax=Candidatus Staskawicziibacteriota TaxID=1817916 RepID=A0A1G2HKX4_9BACT|nr:MAG: cobalamin biosynthesis-like protein [Parcubacteria group bacterium GW2011_GWA2_33_14]OGZ63069.1 MAG: hypothetical protein A2639_02830 [Candidatus Staskawiczbacteria bacterium RIFCSPHIGHO2_01_FULL_34_27]OGZ66812.1 MAG: hypothetical protein A3C58_00840 [Candidatus Staskawiczbacteria bacterium RIFCSPHIGHO2_02_FULL_34_10]